MASTASGHSRFAVDERRRWLLAPREHGAWGLILQPFLAAAILAQNWNWKLGVALVLILAAFLSREPILVLARQHWVWRDRKPETGDALRSLLLLAPILMISTLALIASLPTMPMLGLGLLGAAMTALGTWMGVTNRQRSTELQGVSSLGLGAGAHLAALASTGRVDGWVWALWGYLTVHAISGIQIIHARLKMRIAANTGRRSKSGRNASITLGVVAAMSVGIGLLSEPIMALPLAATAAMHLGEFARLRQAEALQERLTLVGFRNLGWALIQTTITIIVLWKAWPGR